jgi:acyl-CoA reductase-like NAD-dependent aldehyde dehydrogenase
MRIVPELDHKIRREIRDARAKDPLVTVVDLQEQLEKQFNRTFSRKYIAKLAMKVERQALVEADRTKLEERMQFTRENYRMMRERSLKIIYWKSEDGGKPPGNRDVNEAAKNIVMIDLAIHQAEAAAGMYKKPVEVLAREVRYDPLPPETRMIVIAAWERGGLLPQAAIEQMVPARADVSAS